VIIPRNVGPPGRRLNLDAGLGLCICTIAVEGGNNKMDFGLEASVGDGGGAGSATALSASARDDTVKRTENDARDIQAS
jgi:hypothetical protein